MTDTRIKNGLLRHSADLTPEKRITDAQYREAASRMYHADGYCEVDNNAKLSRGDDMGCYVQAWVWVPNVETRQLTPKERKRWTTQRKKG
jgi:hypothetical protein